MRRRAAMASLGGLAVAAAAAFVWLPAMVVRGATSDGTTLVRDAADGVTDYWAGAARAALPPSLASVVDEWRRYHAVKALTAAVAAVALLALARLLRRGAGRRRLAGIPAVAAAGSGAFAVLLVMANVQGTVSPLASLVSLLPVGRGSFATTSAQIERALAVPGSSGRPPALGVLVADFARYHAAVAVMAGLLCAGLLALAARSWRRGAGRARYRTAAGWVVACALMGLVVAANVSTALAPAPALQAFFAGGS